MDQLDLNDDILDLGQVAEIDVPLELTETLGISFNLRLDEEIRKLSH